MTTFQGETDGKLRVGSAEKGLTKAEALDVRVAFDFEEMEWFFDESVVGLFVAGFKGPIPDVEWKFVG